MGLFGFGKKKSKKEAEPAVEPVDEDKVAAAEANAAAKAESAETVLAEPASEYQGRGEERGPWDVNDEDVPDYDDYLDLGAYYLPFLQGIQLRIKANRATQQVLGSTITFGSSSLEIEAFAAPKTLGLWDDVRGDLLEANKAASEVDGVFGTELKLPVNVKGGKTVSRPAAADVTPGQMLKKTTFWLYYVWAIAVSAAGLALISQASGVVWQASADQTAASVATIVGLISICNAVGRVLFGGMYDKYGRSLSMQLVNGLFILTSAVLLLAMSRGSVTVVILGFVLGGLAYSGVTPTNSAFCRAYFGPGHYPVNFPLINTNLIFASFGSTVSGALYDAGGSYNSTFLLIIGLAAVGIVCSLAISAIDKKGN